MWPSHPLPKSCYSSLPACLHGVHQQRQTTARPCELHARRARCLGRYTRCSAVTEDGCNAQGPSRRSLIAAAAGCGLLLSSAGSAEASFLPLELRRALQGPGNFLRARQRANAGEFILSPIKGSRQKLETAMKALEQLNVYDPDPQIFLNALNMIRSASLNCYAFQANRRDTIETKASLLQRQLRIGDACTFRLIEKNVVALLPPSKDHLKNQAAGALSDLIRSYEDLDDILYRAHSGDVFAAEKAFDALQYTISSAASFQTIIEQCLDLPSRSGPQTSLG